MLVVLVMRVSSNKVKEMVKVNNFMLMEISIWVFGKMINGMVLELIYDLIALSILQSGKMTKELVVARKSKLMV